MSVNPVNIALQAAGTILDLTPFYDVVRNICFYDQENPKKRIFHGLPIYHTAHLSTGLEERAKICEHPTETGAAIADHRIKQPKTFECELCLPNYFAVYVINELELYYREGKKIIIDSPTGVLSDMVIESLPVRINPATIDRPSYSILFKEVRIIRTRATDAMTDAANLNDITDTAREWYSTGVSAVGDFIGDVTDAIGSFSF